MPENANIKGAKASVVAVEAFGAANSSLMLEDKSRMNKLGDAFGVGFNNPPGHVYEWNMSKAEAREEFTKLCAAVLADPKGTVLNLMVGEKPAGFSVVPEMTIFTNAVASINAGKTEKPEDFSEVNRQLVKLQRIAQENGHSLDNIGYIADVVVSPKFRGHGFGNLLIERSIEISVQNGNTACLAWTVNPVMCSVLVNSGFNRLKGIGSTGKGIDFAVDKKTGIIVPTVSVPENKYGKVNAKHYLLDLRRK